MDQITLEAKERLAKTIEALRNGDDDVKMMKESLKLYLILLLDIMMMMLKIQVMNI